MSGVDPGTYYITSVVPYLFGNPLAVTFAGVYRPLFASELSNDSSQRWRVDGDSGQLQMISVDSDPYIHACGEERYVVGIPGSECTWLIFPALTGNGFNIGDRVRPISWTLDNPTESGPVISNPIFGPPPQAWEFIPV